MIPDAIAYYHGLLDDAGAAENDGRLREMMAARQLSFGGRPLCTVLRPHFLSPHEYRMMEQVCGTLLAAFDRLFGALVEEPALRAEVGLTPDEEAAFAIDPGYRTPTPTARLDSFLTHNPGGDPIIQFVEYNAETPAGSGYEDILGEAFFELPVMKAFQERYAVRMIPVRQRVLDTLLAMHREAGGREPATIGIVDWEEVPTRSEFEIFLRYFHDQGVAAHVTTPEALEYDGQRLHAAGRPVDILYKRVLGSELLQRYGLDHPIIDALRDGNVTMVNPFRCKPLHKKMSFAMLSDERFGGLYTARQQAAIARHIPWTRKVEARRTLIDGQEVDLLEHVAAHRDQFVLKPNDEYGGKGVIIGWESDADAWDRALAVALDEPSIVQRKVTIAYEDYPALVNGRLDLSQRLVDLDPFLFEGRVMHGLLTRLSASTLLNVTAGSGSVTPSFIVEPR